jgi:hypothetical protein
MIFEPIASARYGIGLIVSRPAGLNSLEKLRFQHRMSAGYNAARLVLFPGNPVRSPLLLAHLACIGLLAALAAPAACVGSVDRAESLNDDGDAGAASDALCRVDTDCVPAGPKCCGCPTFAVPRTDPVARACSNVGCPMSECAENVIARCSEGRCELACAPRACELTGPSCAYGFAADLNGCLTCECAVPVADGCTASADCAQTRADCCGCQEGGSDTAVLSRDKAAYDAMLMCPPTPACPGLDTCTADVPTCVQGRCELVSPALPVGACGRSDLPPCPAGTECMVNVSDQANMHGVGVCSP